MNALGLPTVTRTQRMGYAIRPLKKALGFSLKASVIGVIAGLSISGAGPIAADYFSDPAVEAATTYYSAMVITSTIVGSKVLVGLVGLGTPYNYIKHRKTPVYNHGTYNHEVGRRVRNLYL